MAGDVALNKAEIIGRCLHGIEQVMRMALSSLSCGRRSLESATSER